MSTTMVLLVAPLVLAAVLAATGPRTASRHRGPRAVVGRGDDAYRPRHARPSP
ncbi:MULTISPECIES: hypothetical protein [unclassified Streptomyces]|uniref:hypothetical protein n=1 Tax=Streptomycetaceae TaxID=2062 RepID=UPI002E79769F|nr:MULTISPECIES: hypothetical protein [unclassified Streptomyces]MED7952077.1 hypothetical protein [Streptomyces sp. BE303]MEE1822401.1 hypothetical protein [Streptomyces sp. BE20]